MESFDVDLEQLYPVMDLQQIMGRTKIRGNGHNSNFRNLTPENVDIIHKFLANHPNLKMLGSVAAPLLPILISYLAKKGKDWFGNKEEIDEESAAKLKKIMGEGLRFN